MSVDITVSVTIASSSPSCGLITSVLNQLFDAVFSIVITSVLLDSHVSEELFIEPISLNFIAFVTLSISSPKLYIILAESASSITFANPKLLSASSITVTTNSLVSVKPSLLSVAVNVTMSFPLLFAGLVISPSVFIDADVEDQFMLEPTLPVVVKTTLFLILSLLSPSTYPILRFSFSSSIID